MPLSGLRARVWIDTRHFFSRAEAQVYCWLWLLGADGRVRALRTEARHREQDDLLRFLLPPLGDDSEVCRLG